jgi:ABC-type nitrate/sulfonate/bicarbonate transport system substrate-binding protein
VVVSQDLAGKSIAAADDTEEIVRSALEQIDPTLRDSVTIVPMPREEKLVRFRAGEVDSMQVYTTTEALQLQKDFGEEAPVIMPFGGRHGYAQVIYGHVDALSTPRQRNVARAFLDATYEGWSRALRDPESAAELVGLARSEAGVRGVEGPRILLCMVHHCIYIYW